MTQPITRASVFTSGAKDVEVRANHTGDDVRVAPGHSLEFAGRKRCRINGDAAFSATEGRIEQGAFPGHQRSQTPDLIEVSVGVGCDTASLL